MTSGGELRTLGRAAELPEAWDGLCATRLQHRAFLEHCERTNPCGQRYHLLVRDGVPAAGAVSYRFDLDLFTFLPGLRLPVPATVIGLPASLPPAGVVGPCGAVRDLLAALLDTEPGLVLVLNLAPSQVPPGARTLRLLPEMVFGRRFAGLADYASALRSPWRRRMDRIRRRFTGVATVRTGCGAFTRAHHDLYLQVRGRSATGLEILGLDFFRGLPDACELVSHYAAGRLVCWRIVLVEDGRVTFVLGGHDYGLNGRYASYFNNLYGLLDDAFAAGARVVELGQTAEDPKARLGAEPVETRMILRHGRRWLDRLVGLAGPLVAYRGRCPAYRVFRPGEVPS